MIACAYTEFRECSTKKYAAQSGSAAPGADRNTAYSISRITLPKWPR